MSRTATTPAAAGGLDVAATAAWVSGRRWFASKSRAIAQIEVQDGGQLSPELVILLAHATFADGAQPAGERYQLPLALLDSGAAGQRPRVATTADGRVAVDAVADPELARELLRAIAQDRDVATAAGRLRFRHTGDAGSAPLDAPARPIGVEQSNSSIVFGDRTVLKVFRRLEAGISPELELVRFLTERGYPNIAPLEGYYEYDAGDEPITLGVAQRFFAGTRDGWTLALDQIASDPERLVARIGELGQATAELHNALSCDSRDPAFVPETPEPDFADRLAGRVEREIEAVFARLPADERTAPIAGRADAVAAELQRRGRAIAGGRLIRTHGDYHLGQTLSVDGDRSWVIIDFEGEPARALSERRRKTSPLRDVAGMLRSLSYAAAAAGLLSGVGGDRFSHVEQRARTAYLERYLASVDPGLLPAGKRATTALLSLYELEKTVYELAYELDNRPDWLTIPVTGIVSLLEDS